MASGLRTVNIMESPILDLKLRRQFDTIDTGPKLEVLQ